MAKAKEKKSNIYRVITKVRTEANGEAEEIGREDYVRAKTAAGAAKIARENACKVTAVATLATQDDLLALATKVSVLGEKAGA